jgi:hypothetical protein
LPHPERPGSRTDERTASSTTRAPVPTRRARSPDTTYYSNARPGSGEARREPADIAVIHLAAGFRDSLTFLRIGSFASARRRPAGLLPLRRDRPVIHSRRIRNGGRHVNRGCAPRASLLPLPVKSSAGFFNRRSSRTCPRLRCEFSPKAPRAQRAFADRRPISAQFTAMRAIQAAIASYLGIPIATRRGRSTFSNRRTRERERERERERVSGGREGAGEGRNERESLGYLSHYRAPRAPRSSSEKSASLFPTVFSCRFDPAAIQRPRAHAHASLDRLRSINPRRAPDSAVSPPRARGSRANWFRRGS